MNNTINIFGGLILGSAIFLTAINYMANNIEDFESVPLPPPKQSIISTNNPFIKIDATSRKKWTLVNFSTREFYRVDDLEKEKDNLKNVSWDIGFQRTKIISNGGMTNPKGIVGLKNMGPIDFNSLVDVPTTGYLQDAKSYGKILNKAIVDWYIYRTRTHNIESQKNVYAVRTDNGGYLKMKILNYYCTRDESACKTIMCGRQEAACYMIEYVISNDNKQFEPSTLTQQVSIQPKVTN